jgi:N-acetylglucosaminyldiphosphoundecaprenol N-acetyl-beta-D-mannosaminyltransferase
VSTVEYMPPESGMREIEDQTQVHANRGFLTFEVMGVQIAATTVAEAIETLTTWLKDGTSTRLVTFTNVHMLTEGSRNHRFGKLLRTTDMNCPDGMPLVWIGKRKGKPVSRVCGPEFMPAFCVSLGNSPYRHFFYGGKPGVPERVISELKQRNPDLLIAGYFSPPFGEVGPRQDEEVVRMINDSGADIVWVCLGCPKQEMWMLEHRDRLNARLMLAVGLAFDIVAGQKKRAPSILRGIGMEWFYRMMTEPRRLVWRYLLSNSVFLYHVIRDGVLEHTFLGHRHRRQAA